MLSRLSPHKAEIRTVPHSLVSLPEYFLVRLYRVNAAYARLMLQEVAVTRDEIRICGSKAVLARCASENIGETTPAVLSFVQKWRARKDSNL